MCSSGCPTPGAHKSWGECVRSKSTTVFGLETTGSGIGYSYSKAFDRETENYAQAVREGLDPAACTNEAVEAARKAADKAGAPVPMTN